MTRKYLSGFNNYHSSEYIAGTLHAVQNTPQQCPMGLYAEQISGAAFTVDRQHNLHTWLYRILPSVTHSPFKQVGASPGDSAENVVAKGNNRLNPTTSGVNEAVVGGPANDFVAWNVQGHFDDGNTVTTPNQLRWDPFTGASKGTATTSKTTFVTGLHTICGSGDSTLKHGVAVHVYVANQNMVDEAFYNSDGDLLIVPQTGTLDIQTEMGFLSVEPTEIIVIPRGIRFAVVGGCSASAVARGYVLEVFDGHFDLPELGPIGANGLASARHFLYPVACPDASAEKLTRPHRIYNKYGGALFVTRTANSPFDVIAWHGNYGPFKYDLKKFCVINSVSFDHLDPSIFTVLTCKSNSPGTAVADFVIFPPRWSVQENTFRPPYFHRNCMSEFMGLIHGEYEAKKDGFLPGGASLHSCMTPHGPDAKTCQAASKAVLKPERVAEGTLAFMFESCFMMQVTKWALQKAQPEYYKAWSNIPRLFDLTLLDNKNGSKKRTVDLDDDDDDDEQQRPSSFKEKR